MTGPCVKKKNCSIASDVVLIDWMTVDTAPGIIPYMQLSTACNIGQMHRFVFRLSRVCLMTNLLQTCISTDPFFVSAILWRASCRASSEWNNDVYTYCTRTMYTMNVQCWHVGDLVEDWDGTCIDSVSLLEQSASEMLAEISFFRLVVEPRNELCK
jgi:hypothetical protein